MSRHLSEETRQRLRLQKLGSKNPMFGKIPYNKGKSPSDESREKMRLAHKDRSYIMIYGEERAKVIRQKISQANKNQIPWIKGKHHTVETRANISYNLRGEKSYLWKGGISFELYTPSFNRYLKETIRQRDIYLCQECNISQEDSGRKLYIHHIDYDKKNNSPENLLSLCLSCHAKTNSNRDYWENKYRHLINSKQIEEIFLPYMYNERTGQTMFQMLEKQNFRMQIEHKGDEKDEESE